MMAIMGGDPGQLNDQPQLSSTYPSAPMEYANVFTNENVKFGRIPPPPPIIKDSYMSFGKLIDPNDILIRSLESQGLQRLYTPPELLEKEANSTTPLPNGFITNSTDDENLTKPKSSHINTNNHKRELKKLNHSILIAYLDLLEILVRAPNTQIQIEQTIATNTLIDHQSLTGGTGAEGGQPETITTTIIKTLREQKLEDIELLFINMHHLINELRPHQARDNIRCTLEMQKQQRIETAQKFKQHLYKIVGILKKCIQSIQSSSTSLTCFTNSDGSISKTNVFLDELSSLVTNANNLTKSLDKIDKTSSNTLNLNGDCHQNNHHHDTEQNDSDSNDVEMESFDNSHNNNNNNNMEQNPKKNAKFNNKFSISIHNDTKISTNNRINSNGVASKKKLNSLARSNEFEEQSTDNCDFKDLILCDLIDEFLIKENEF